MAFRRSLVATTWILSLLYYSCDGQKSPEVKSLFDKDERDLLLFRGPKLLSYYEELSSYSSLEAKDIGTYHNLIAEELHSTLSESENFPNNEEEYLSMALEQITQSLCTDFISGKLTGGSGKGEREIGVEEIALIQECAGEVDTMFEKALDEVADDASTVSKMTEDKMPYTSSRLFNVTEYFVSTTQMFDNIVPDFEMIGYFNKIMDLTLSLNYENAEPTIDEFNAIIDQVEADIAGDEMTAREELRIVAVQAVASVAASSTELWSTHFQDSDSAYTKFMTKEGRMDTNYICLLNIFIWAVFRDVVGAIFSAALPIMLTLISPNPLAPFIIGFRILKGAAIYSLQVVGIEIPTDFDLFFGFIDIITPYQNVTNPFDTEANDLTEQCFDSTR